MVSMMTYFFSTRGFGHPVFSKPHFGHPVMKILAKTLAVTHLDLVQPLLPQAAVWPVPGHKYKKLLEVVQESLPPSDSVLQLLFK